MRSRATSRASSGSSLEFSHSDIENLGSELGTVDIGDLSGSSPNTTPDLRPTEPPEYEDGPHAKLEAVSGSECKPDSKPRMQRDPVFYCETVVLQVEDTLFCVPKSGLVEEGTYFNSLLSQVRTDFGSQASSPGSSDHNPIILDGVKKNHFQHFLRLIYPFRGVEAPETDDQWLSILQLATQWNFPDIRETALTHLEHLFKSPSSSSVTTHDPICALAFCIRYDVTQHLAHQYELIITSITPLKREKMVAAGLGTDTIQLITDMREEWLCGMVWGNEGLLPLTDADKALVPRRIPAKFIVNRNLNPSDNSAGDDDKQNSCQLEESRLAEELEILKERELFCRANKIAELQEAREAWWDEEIKKARLESVRMDEEEVLLRLIEEDEDERMEQTFLEAEEHMYWMMAKQEAEIKCMEEEQMEMGMEEEERIREWQEREEQERRKMEMEERDRKERERRKHVDDEIKRQRLQELEKRIGELALGIKDLGPKSWK
ncbi:hypothetical protein BJ165DRAFT_1000502 [Panaeolus papilionaceus]|nr:hypothetical protein BJ165DRAFT_1000502 [Panaeolus papilionaceus]